MSVAWARCLTVASVAVAGCTAGAGAPDAAAPGDGAARLRGVRAEGAPSVILDGTARAALGLAAGPESVVARTIDSDGTVHLLFAATTRSGARGTFRFRSDGALAHLSADPALDPAPPGGPEPAAVLAPGRLDPNPGVPGSADGGAGQAAFDLDRAGGGTLIDCPDFPGRSTGRTLYFYHGENRTDASRGAPPVDGDHAHGWSGLGLSYWDPLISRFRKSDQIIGLDRSNGWSAPPDARTPQTPLAAGQASVVLEPDSLDLYLFYDDGGDGAGDPAAAACAGRPCVAVARAGLVDVCSNVKSGARTLWRKRYLGAFAEPGVLDPSATSTARPPGTGGHASPLFSADEDGGGQAVPSVTYLPARRTWLMVYVGGDGAIALRSSGDGLAWSPPARLIAPPAAGALGYPTLLVDGADDLATAAWSLLYTEAAPAGDPSGGARLVRQPLAVAWD